MYSHVYGDGVPHLHVHLQALYPNTPASTGKSALAGASIIVSLAEWPQAPRGYMESVRSFSCASTMPLSTSDRADRVRSNFR